MTVPKHVLEAMRAALAAAPPAAPRHEEPHGFAYRPRRQPYGYHAAPKAALPSIARQGLVPSARHISLRFGGPVVFFVTTLDRLQNFMRSDDMVVLRFPLPRDARWWTSAAEKRRVVRDLAQHGFVDPWIFGEAFPVHADPDAEAEHVTSYRVRPEVIEVLDRDTWRRVR